MKFYNAVAAGMVLSAVPMVAQMKATPTTAAPITPRRMAGQPISPVVRVGTMTITTKDGVSEPIALMSVARDSASGLPTGKRMHKPFVITKEIDRTSPMLMAAMNNHEVLPTIVITAEGTESDTGKLGSGLGGGKASLQDISILRIRQVSKTTEEITFAYASGTATSPGGGLTDIDVWSTSK